MSEEDDLAKIREAFGAEWTIGREDGAWVARRKRALSGDERLCTMTAEARAENPAALAAELRAQSRVRAALLPGR